jgi:hypothetical protein
VGYGPDRLVPQDLYRLRVDELRLLAPVQKGGGLNAEHVRQGDHLAYRRIGNGTVPDSLYFPFAEVPRLMRAISALV